MKRIIALAILLACVGCSTSKNSSLAQTNDFLFQKDSDFFSTANMGGDPLPVANK